MIYNLEERTASFGENIIDFCKKLSRNNINMPLVDKLIRSGTSIGANYMEANGAASKKDFKNKCFICKKEAMETKYWLRMIAKADVEFTEECRTLWREAQELTLIFSKITASSKDI